MINVESTSLLIGPFSVTGSRLLSYWKNMWLRTMYCSQIIWQENKKFQQRSWSATIPCREDMVHLKPVLTSCCKWQVNSVAWLVVSLQIWNSKNADVLLDSRLNLFDIMDNLCSKLYCEVLLTSWNYVAYLLKWTSTLNFNKRGCVRQIWVD